jgi:hypothetical protein
MDPATCYDDRRIWSTLRKINQFIRQHPLSAISTSSNGNSNGSSSNGVSVAPTARAASPQFRFWIPKAGDDDTTTTTSEEDAADTDDNNNDTHDNDDDSGEEEAVTDEPAVPDNESGRRKSTRKRNIKSEALQQPTQGKEKRVRKNSLTSTSTVATRRRASTTIATVTRAQEQFRQ